MNHPAADQVADLIAGEVRAGQHGDDARHLARRLNIEAFDRGMGMRGAHEHRAGFARPADVVGVLPLAGNEADVFLAAHRRADSGRAHGGLLP